MEELYQAIKAMDSSDNQDKMISEAQKLLSGQAPNARDAAVLGMAGVLGLAHPFGVAVKVIAEQGKLVREQQDRKSTRLNSSHSSISYAVFCLKKKTEAGSLDR